MMAPRLRELALSALILLWLGAVGSASAWLWSYKQTPGAQANAPEQWPAASTLPASSEQPTLVMLAHPMCPCTRATSSELRRLLGAAGAQVRTHVVVVRPPGAPEWKTPDYLAELSTLPGVTVTVDPGAREARHFGASVSGQVVLYSPAGRLLFRGGITSARGHEGENAGASAVLALLRGHSPSAEQSLVYGCGLEDSEAAESGENDR